MKQKFTIGRDPSCDLCIADESVSRIHADLTLTGEGALSVQDRGSRNGTRLVRAGLPAPLRQEALRPTDQLEFGEARLAVADIVAALRQKFAQSAPPVEAAAAPRPTPAKPALSPQAARLERCACGAIKPTQQICPECGQ